MTDFPKRRMMTAALAATVAFAVGALAPGAGWTEEDYPTRPITMLIGYAAGGQTDLVGRGAARVLSHELGVPVNVVNRPGSGGLVATQALQRTQPDGYTILFQGHSVVNADPFLVAQVDFVPDDFEYAGMITAFQLGLATQRDAPFDTLAEFVEWARDNPGFVYGSLGPGARLYMEAIAEAEGLQANIIPLQGGGDMINALLGRQVVLAYSGGLHYRYPDEIKTIAVTTTYRHPSAPDVETINEQGYPLAMDTRTTLILPRGTPRAILERLSDALAAAQTDEEFQRITGSADIPIMYLDLDQAAEEVHRSYETNLAIFAAAGIEPR
ncbi:tripartite tricarboxylate transporter substrate binding protein [Pararhodobacter sp.]|uniref:tripartite tricarboxylate transporter substrate binding protein n=1 Tax=Pararhodobacter sp. TaxID=2127056 RepID=UPI002FDD0E75